MLHPRPTLRTDQLTSALQQIDHEVISGSFMQLKVLMPMAHADTASDVRQQIGHEVILTGPFATDGCEIRDD
jgi:hypothetical protein